MNGLNTTNFQDLSPLLPLKEQIVWLKLASMPISAKSFEMLGQFPNLTRLMVEGTEFGDSQAKSIKFLKHLQILNLVETPITDKGLEDLAQIKSLKKVYLWQSKVSPVKAKEMQVSFPNTEWNFGEELPKNQSPNPLTKAIL